MPNRIIKETIRTSKSVNALSDFQFRMWLYLITYVDDYGCGSADPELLKGFVFPRRKGVTEAQIRDTLAALANMGMIVLYEADGESYFYFPKWGDHQRIQSKVRKYPDPADATVSHGESTFVTVSHGESQLESNPNTNTESNPNTKENARARHQYGEYKNVLLSDEDLEKLKAEFPDWEQRIERLSEYIAKTGKSYKNHLAVIRSWARTDKKDPEPEKERRKEWMKKYVGQGRVEGL